MYQGKIAKEEDPYLHCAEKDKVLHVLSSSCWKCGKGMKVAVLSCEGENFLYGPEYFSEKDLKIARQNGAIIKEIFSKTLKDTYNANICSNCEAFVGSFFLFHDYFVFKDKLPTVTIKYSDL